MVNFEELQNKVIETLTAGIQEIPIELYPDKPNEYQLTHPDGVILVYTEGARYSDSTSKGSVMQRGRVNFGVSLCLRDLANNKVALNYLSRICSALLGLEVSNYTYLGRMQLESIVSAHDEGEGVWVYKLSFYMPHEIAQKFPN